MTDFPGLLKALVSCDAEFILIGGVAATIHGSARLTRDVDIVYLRTQKNLERLAEALQKYHPYLRDAPPGLPFRWDVETLQRGLNFTLETDLGSIDLFGSIPGGESYEELKSDSETVEIFGMKLKCLNLARLIRVKRASGRARDLDVIAELEAIQEELDEP